MDPQIWGLVLIFPFFYQPIGCHTTWLKNVQDQEMITNKRAHVSHRYLRWLFSSCYPLVNIQKTSENHHFWWENPLFSLPEGNWNAHPSILYVPTGGTHFKNQLPSPTASWKNFPSANWHNKHETYGQTVLLSWVHNMFATFYSM